jgi:sigma-B regulation protein RsbU (phosphoserine phosphatase)
VYVLPAAGGEVVALEEAAPMIGIVEPLPTVDRTLALEPGDRLVLWTDGVTDASAPDGERFGEPRFLETLRRVPPGADADATLGAALAEVERWIDGSAPADDITLVVAECVAT